ncbi:MAG: ArsR/SmtB family transcription factor, partial [Acidimicrobiales bacterium]
VAPRIASRASRTVNGRGLKPELVGRRRAPGMATSKARGSLRSVPPGTEKSLATATAARNDDLRLDRLFSALASQPRRDIVDHLATGPATTPEIGRRFDFSKQALNRHVVALEEAG